MADKDSNAVLLAALLSGAPHRGERDGLTGRLDPSTGLVETVSSAPRNKVWVRLGASSNTDAGRSTVAVWNTPPTRVTTRRWNIPVTIGYNKRGELRVTDFDAAILDNVLGDAIDLANHNPLPDEVDETLLKIRNLKDFRPRYDSVTGGLWLYVEAGNYSGIIWPGGSIDLAAEQTGTGGKKAFVVVGFDTNAGALVALGGTDYSYATSIEVMKPDIATTFADAVFIDAFPVAAVPLTDVATVFTTTDVIDLRDPFSGSTGTSTDERAKVSAADTTTGYLSDKLTAGANITLTINNPGANEEYEIAATPGGGVGTANITPQAYATARPATPNTGDVVLLTNSPLSEYYTGAVWRPFGLAHHLTYPPSASWSWDNQGSSTVAGDGYIHLATPANASALLRVRYRTAPSAPYVLTVAILPVGVATPAANGHGYGILFRESGSGKIITLSIQWSNGNYPVITPQKWTDSSTFSAGYIATAPALTTPPMFLRIADDNSNRISSVSVDKQQWYQIHSVGRTDFATPDQIGFFVNAQDATWGQAATVFSWEIT